MLRTRTWNPAAYSNLGGREAKQAALLRLNLLNNWMALVFHPSDCHLLLNDAGV